MQAHRRHIDHVLDVILHATVHEVQCDVATLHLADPQTGRYAFLPHDADSRSTATMLGAAIVHRGVTGHCAVYGALGVDTSNLTGNGLVSISTLVTPFGPMRCASAPERAERVSISRVTGSEAAPAASTRPA